MIRPTTDSDAESIVRIYNHYIRNTIVTFEEQTISADEIATRMRKVRSQSLPYLVAVENDRVVGYSYASKWHDRSAYRFSVETTVYLDADYVGRGFGSELYEALMEQLKEKGMHVAVGGISLPNAGSIALHEKFGFKKVAHFSEAGIKFGTWIDVGYWQRML